MNEHLPPVEVAVTLTCSVEHAFRTFADKIDSWWPKQRFSIGQEASAGVVFEPFVDGEIYELTLEGERHVWGRVLIWNPPSRLAFSWHPAQPVELDQLVEVTFRNAGDATEVVLRHSGWEKLAERAAAVRGEYDAGWAVVLGEYRKAADQQTEVSG